jgi:hypothetical protein
MKRSDERGLVHLVQEGIRSYGDICSAHPQYDRILLTTGSILVDNYVNRLSKLHIVLSDLYEKFIGRARRDDVVAGENSEGLFTNVEEQSLASMLLPAFPDAHHLHGCSSCRLQAPLTCHEC